MQKPIDKPEFWKERIQNALKDHYSVYVAHEALWNRINQVHNELLDKIIPQDSKVLDAGCGYGRWSHKFKNYTGVDFSPDFLSKAKSKYPDKEFIQSKLEVLPFKDKEFDWAFCVSIKKMVVDNQGEEKWLEMEKELKRVAKNILILEYEVPEIYEVL